MGGQSDLSLSSHRKDDESFNTKRKELQQFLPQLEQHLTLLRSRGEQWQECGTYSVLHNLYQTLTNKRLRVPIHVLLGGEDLLKREVLHTNDTNTTSEAIECIWRSTHFRSSIRQKLTETLQEIPRAHLSNLAMIDPEAIEAHLFANSKSKDEYLELTARVIIHFKHLNNELKKENSTANQMNTNVQLPSSMEKQGNNTVQEPLKRAAESLHDHHYDEQPERKRFQQGEKCKN